MSRAKGATGSGEAPDTSPGGKRVPPLDLEGQMCCQRHLSADPNQGGQAGVTEAGWEGEQVICPSSRHSLADDSHWPNWTRSQEINESGRYIEKNFPGHRSRRGRAWLWGHMAPCRPSINIKPIWRSHVYQQINLHFTSKFRTKEFTTHILNRHYRQGENNHCKCMENVFPHRWSLQILCSQGLQNWCLQGQVDPINKWTGLGGR